MQTIDNIYLGEVHGEEDSGRTRAGLGAESRAAGSTCEEEKRCEYLVVLI